MTRPGWLKFGAALGLLKELEHLCLIPWSEVLVWLIFHSLTGFVRWKIQIWLANFVFMEWNTSRYMYQHYRESQGILMRVNYCGRLQLLVLHSASSGSNPTTAGSRPFHTRFLVTSGPKPTRKNWYVYLKVAFKLLAKLCCGRGSSHRSPRGAAGCAPGNEARRAHRRAPHFRGSQRGCASPGLCFLGST